MTYYSSNNKKKLSKNMNVQHAPSTNGTFSNEFGILFLNFLKREFDTLLHA